jgi:flagellar basal-body rod protein FlgG
MHEVLAVALTSMQQDMSRVDRVASNLANVSTPGFKREVLVVPTFGQAVASALGSARSPETVRPELAAGPVVMSDARAGSVRVTGQPLDLAIEGDGYFEVMTSGGPAYTRQGDFQVDARGRLVTSRGEPVMGVSGEIVLTTRTPSIDADGKVTEPLAVGGPGSGSPATAVGQLKVVHLDRPQQLERLGGGLVTGGEAVAKGEGAARVRQGALENSNVNSAQEMVQLLQTMRHFESMQKVAQGYDEMLGATIHKLGDL